MVALSATSVPGTRVATLVGLQRRICGDGGGVRADVGRVDRGLRRRRLRKVGMGSRSWAGAGRGSEVTLAQGWGSPRYHPSTLEEKGGVVIGRQE